VKFGRREFLRFGAVSGIAPFAAGRQEPRIGEVSRYVTLGRTGLKISDISFGSSRLRRGEDDLVRHAMDKGVNYFDTAEDYTGGASENVIGRALEGRRDKVFITSKTKAGAQDRQDSMMRSLENSLRRLRTDYIDVYFNHAVNTTDRLENSEWHEFVGRAKDQGKIRFTGMSGHGGRLIECLDYALDRDIVDVVLVAYNYGQDPSFFANLTRSFDFIALQPELPRVLAKAKSKNVGVVAMKTLMGARLNDMRPYERNGSTFAQAAFTWVLKDSNVDSLIVSMTSRSKIDEFLGASGAETLSISDISLLERYAIENHATYCRHACADCESACPYGVAIPDVLRMRMYATDYGDPRFAKEEYSKLEANANACLTCSGKPCANACTYGISIPKYTGATHRMLA
jgi:predicted aldo/keto reductase-like oxidoreductase